MSSKTLLSKKHRRSGGRRDAWRLHIDRECHPTTRLYRYRYCSTKIILPTFAPLQTQHLQTGFSSCRKPCHPRDFPNPFPVQQNVISLVNFSLLLARNNTLAYFIFWQYTNSKILSTEKLPYLKPLYSTQVYSQKKSLSRSHTYTAFSYHNTRPFDQAS